MSEDGGPESEGNGGSYTQVDTRHQLPSERFPQEDHLPVLKNLVKRSKFGDEAISTSQIEEGLKTQQAQLNVKFLGDIDLIEKDGNKWTPTDRCVSFVKKLNINKDTAREEARPVIKNTWFYDVAKSTLQLEEQVSRKELMEELALETEVSDFDKKERSFKVIIDWLVWTGLLEENEEEELSLTESADNGQKDSPEQREESEASMPQKVPDAVSSPEADQSPIRKSWEGHYALTVKPDSKSIELLQKAVEELKEAIEIVEEDAQQDS